MTPHVARWATRSATADRGTGRQYPRLPRCQSGNRVADRLLRNEPVSRCHRRQSCLGQGATAAAKRPVATPARSTSLSSPKNVGRRRRRCHRGRTIQFWREYPQDAASAASSDTAPTGISSATCSPTRPNWARLRLANTPDRLAKWMSDNRPDRTSPLWVLLQVNIARDPAKFGLLPEAALVTTSCCRRATPHRLAA